VSVCWFHYGQTIMKRLKKICLSEAYQNEETTQAVFRCLLALPPMPVTDIDYTIRYDTRCYFNVRSKADISQLNLPHGTDN